MQKIKILENMEINMDYKCIENINKRIFQRIM